MNHVPFCSTSIRFCTKEGLVDELMTMDYCSIVLVMSNSSAIRWGLGRLACLLQEKSEGAGGAFCWIRDITSNPGPHDIVRALSLVGRRPVDAIVAIGGGSVIDLAKSIKAFYGDPVTSAQSIRGAIARNSYCDNSIDIIAVPSTAGTGSEVTRWATIWDVGTKKKLSIESSELQPRVALIVPELTTTLPAMLTLTTGLDAVAHATEAYWSKGTSPLVQELAYHSIQLIIEHLRAAVRRPDDLRIREALCVASVLAGLAFAQTRTTACHSISYPLTLFYGITHGAAVAMTLGPVSRVNAGHFPNDERLFELFWNYGGLGEWIDHVCAGIINMRLSQFGIAPEDIPLIVSHAFTEGRMDNNPIDLTEEQVQEILLSVL